MSSLMRDESNVEEDLPQKEPHYQFDASGGTSNLQRFEFDAKLGKESLESAQRNQVSLSNHKL